MKAVSAISIGIVVIFAACITLLIIAVSTVISTLNNETAMRNGVVAQEKVRNANFDKMWKVIQEKTQITKASAETRKELVQSLVEGREATMIKIIHESNPESAFSGEDFAALSNAVESQRESLFREEKFLISKYQTYSTYFDSVFPNFVLSVLGRQKLDSPLQILSDRTNQAAESGIDNDTKLDL